MALWPFNKADVGLSNVDNTTDLAKPVSTAQQTALDLKAPSDPNRLVIGEEVYSRGLLTASAVVSTSGNLRLVYFTALKAQTTTQVRVQGGSTAAAATPTVIENGLYEINAAGDGTRVAVTANDTSLYSVANGRYTRLWGPYDMVVGQRYALSWLIVSAVATPTYLGYTLASTADLELGLSPRLTGRVSGATTTPVSFTAASVSDTFTRPYGVILP